MMLWQEWWVWALAAVGLAILEVLAPGQVLIGFAVGAAAVSALIALGFAPSIYVLALIFAAVSLLSWFAIRKIFGVRKGQVKIWETDINE
ncbi:MAG: NfeD family protein [Paracoccaceae bacterium]